MLLLDPVVYSRFGIIHISLMRLMKRSKVWTFKKPKMWTFYIFEPLKAHIYEPNISVIRLMLIIQNPDYYTNIMTPENSLPH